VPAKRKRRPVLTEAELRIMNVVWDASCATVSDVRDKLGHNVPYTSVLTMVRVLEQKGYLRIVRTEGRKFVYEPSTTRKEAMGNALTAFVERFFRGSPAMLTASLLETQDISRGELTRMRDLIAKIPDDEP
jgi:BlaI family transcriptional regulator, penicillinase repressor